MTALEQSLARPVVLGYLSVEQALAALAVRNINQQKSGAAEGTATLDERLQLDEYFLNLFITRLVEQRASLTYDIERLVWPLIDRRAPRGRIRAEAHDLNAARDGLLREDEVEQVIVDTLYRQQAKLRRRDGVLAPSPPFRRRLGRRYG